MLKLRIIPKTAKAEKVMCEEYKHSKRNPIIKIIEHKEPYYWIYKARFMPSYQFEAVKKGILVEFEKVGVKRGNLKIERVN